MGGVECGGTGEKAQDFLQGDSRVNGRFIVHIFRGFPLQKERTTMGFKRPASSRRSHLVHSDQNVGSASAEKRIAGYVRYPLEEDQAGEQLTLKTL